MYDRLNKINKKFFHPNDKEYLKDLSRFSSNGINLKVLADMCEPLGLHRRNPNLNYTSKTPLNRFC